MCPAFLKIQVLPKSNRIGCRGAGGGGGGGGGGGEAWQGQLPVTI